MSRYLISGGGTGGHIFPAVSIANALRELEPDCEILFIGAKGRMEMERVPAAGYDIEALRVDGFDREHPLRNIVVAWHLFWALIKARKIVRRFRPDVAIGVGGYVSGAAMKVCQQLHVPVLLQEQNGFAGVTNKMLAKRAAAICVGFPGMERFFPAEKIIVTGTPVRQSLSNPDITRAKACAELGLDALRPVALVIGGSLGARTLNEALLANLKRLSESNVQVVWQTGKNYYDSVAARAAAIEAPNVKIMPFIQRMDWAYAAADVVVSRAGAGSISELAMLAKAAILVPSPNVAEDHQTHNARALSDVDAAIFCADNQAEVHLVDMMLDLLSNSEQRAQLSQNIIRMAHPNAACEIAKKVIELKLK